MSDEGECRDGMNVRRPSTHDVIDLLSSLVAIDSCNPSLVPGAAGEGECASFVASWLRAAGLDVQEHDVGEGRPNVVARLGGKRGGRRLMLNAHMDTVGVAGMTAPFVARLEGDRLYGRGTYDMKGSLAAMMLAIRELARLGGADGDVILTAVVDEEYASLGTQAVMNLLTADGAIVTEPTGLRVCAAHKGFAWIAVDTEGKAAHGSRPDLGVDAIAHMGRVLRSLENIDASLRLGEPHELLGRGSIHASLIDGGQELSSYPQRCRLQIERRTIPGETREAVLAAIQAALDTEADRDPSFRASADLFFWREPFEVAPSEDVVQSLLHSAAQVLGSTPDIYGDTPWMDAALLSAAGIPTVVFGPGGEGAHAVTEYVSIGDVITCAEVLARTALDFSSLIFPVCDGA